MNEESFFGNLLTFYLKNEEVEIDLLHRQRFNQFNRAIDTEFSRNSSFFLTRRNIFPFHKFKNCAKYTNNKKKYKIHFLNNLKSQGKNILY